MHQLIFPASLFSPLYSGPVYQVIGLDLGASSRYASSDQERIANENSEKADTFRVPVYVMSDSPYGGCSLDLGDYEDVLLVAGGADVTFTLGLLDDLIGGIVRHQRVRNERTLRVEFVWIFRSVCHIQWFESMLLDTTEMAADSSLDLYITIFVTCLCQPEAVPLIPKSNVMATRPDVHHLLARILPPTPGSE